MKRDENKGTIQIGDNIHEMPTKSKERATVLNHLDLVVAGKKSKIFFFDEHGEKVFYSRFDLQSSTIKIDGKQYI